MSKRATSAQRPAAAATQGAMGRLLLIHRGIASASLRRMLRTPVSSLVTVFVIAVALLLPALVFALNANLARILDGFQSSAQITLFLYETVDESRGIDVSNYLLTDEAIDSTAFVSREQALAEFGETSGLGGILQELTTNPLPAAIIVVPSDPSPAAVESLVQRLQARSEVELVQLDSRWLQRLDALSGLVTSIGQVLALIVVLGLLFIVGNTIKLMIENRKEEIRVIKLVGGTNSFVARPFLYSGLYFGIAGGVLACLLQALVVTGFSASLQELIQLYEGNFQLQGFDATSAITLILVGATVGWSGALLASLRHINLIGP